MRERSEQTAGSQRGVFGERSDLVAYGNTAPTVSAQPRYLTLKVNGVNRAPIGAVVSGA